MQHMHGRFAVEDVPVLLCQVLQKLHLGVDDVGSIIVAKGCFEVFEDLLKCSNLYICVVIIHLSWLLFCFFIDFLYFYSGRNQFEFDLGRKRVARSLKTNF